MIILILITFLLLLSMYSIESSVIEAYRTLLSTHTLKTNIVTASILTATSDAITQTIERCTKNKSLIKTSSLDSLQSSSSLISKSTPSLISTEPKHDYYRSLTMLVYGGAVFGITNSDYYYNAITITITITITNTITNTINLITIVLTFNNSL